MDNGLKRLFDLLPHLAKQYQKDVILSGKSTGQWVSYSTDEYIANCNHFALGLAELGLKKGDKIITICNSRPEWNVIDMGMSQLGVIHVPLYPNLTTEEYQYLIEHSEAKMAIIGNKVIFNRAKEAFSKYKNVKLYTVDEIDEQAQFKDILSLGAKHQLAKQDELEQIKSTIDEHDTATVIYTSGTTGSPKGVMLSHRNILTNAIACSKFISLTSNDKALSLLPLCHVYERMLNYMYQYLGIAIYYAQNMGTVVRDLNETKANGFTCVPRFLEKVYDQIIAKGKDLNGFKKKIFFWSVKVAERYEPFKKQGFVYELKLKLARKLVLNKWNQALGGNIKMIVSGGAAMQVRLGRIFGAAGLLIQEGYGLTETSPVIGVNGYKANDYMLGTIGVIVEDVEVKIAKDGEILVKGPNVMKGYYKDPEYTAEVIDEDGWLHTGDIGVIIDNRFLKITDRKKSIFKLSSGKYISPQTIENKTKASSFIEQAMIVGENQKYTGLLISPNFDYLHFWANKHNITYRDNQELIERNEVKLRIQKEITNLNKQLAPHEQIKAFRLVSEEWAPNSGELSATLKLKREVVAQKYRELVNSMFNN